MFNFESALGTRRIMCGIPICAKEGIIREVFLELYGGECHTEDWLQLECQGSIHVIVQFLDYLAF